MGFNVKVIGADQVDNAKALVSSRLIAGACRFYSVTVFNTGPDQYIQLFDSAAAAAGGSVPLMQVKVPADTLGYIDYQDGRPMGAGIFIGNSTTSGTYTAGAANCLIDTLYRKTE